MQYFTAFLIFPFLSDVKINFSDGRAIIWLSSDSLIGLAPGFCMAFEKVFKPAGMATDSNINDWFVLGLIA